MRLKFLVIGFFSLAGTLAVARPIALKNSNGRYLVAEGGGGGDVHANRTARGAWETFEMQDLSSGPLMSGDGVCFQTYRRYYIVAEGGGGREVKANRDRCGQWETFRVLKLNRYGGRIDGEIKHQDMVALQAYDGSYVVVERDSATSVNANRPAIGQWERFTIEMY